jgi:hypothetical protein
VNKALRPKPAAQAILNKDTFVIGFGVELQLDEFPLMESV